MQWGVRGESLTLLGGAGLSRTTLSGEAGLGLDGGKGPDLEGRLGRSQRRTHVASSGSRTPCSGLFPRESGGGGSRRTRWPGREDRSREAPGEDAGPGKGAPSLPRTSLWVPAVPGRCVRGLRGGRAAAARRPRSSGHAAAGAGRLRNLGPPGRPGGAAGGLAGRGGRRRAVRRAGRSAAWRAPALRTPPPGRRQPKPPHALPRPSPGCTDVTCEGPRCPFSQLPALPFQLDLCQQVFGISAASVAQAVAQTNSYYGGQTPRATQVLFVNGDTDPWHVLSVTQDLGPSQPALLIPSASHCLDMAPVRPSDSPSLRLGRQGIFQQLQAWLQQAKESQNRAGV